MRLLDMLFGQRPASEQDRKRAELDDIKRDAAETLFKIELIKREKDELARVTKRTVEAMRHRENGRR